MIVYVLMYGYEDVIGIFSSHEKAEKHKTKMMIDETHPRKDNFSTLTEELDAPNSNH